MSNAKHIGPSAPDGQPSSMTTPASQSAEAGQANQASLPVGRTPTSGGSRSADPPSRVGKPITTLQDTSALATAVAALLPKATALDRIACAEGSYCVTDAAKMLQVKPKELFAYLDQHEWTYRRVGADHRCAYQKRIGAGHLVHKVTIVLRPDGTEKAIEQVRVTAHGLTTLAGLVQRWLNCSESLTSSGDATTSDRSGTVYITVLP